MFKIFKKSQTLIINSYLLINYKLQNKYFTVNRIKHGLIILYKKMDFKQSYKYLKFITRKNYH